MAHPNAELAASLVAWRNTKIDCSDALCDAQRKGFVTIRDNEPVITRKGEEFIAKWTQGKPSETYIRKPIEGNDNHGHRTQAPTRSPARDSAWGYR